MYDHEKSDFAIVVLHRALPDLQKADEQEQSGCDRCGAGGAKGGDREECGRAKHTPDFEPGSCDTGARTCTANRRRQLLEVGAVCGKPARTDLRGGRLATAVPTANQDPLRKPTVQMLCVAKSLFDHLVGA